MSRTKTILLWLMSAAYIGAKLGRAKTTPSKKIPWKRTPIEGKIHMGINQAPKWPPSRGCALAWRSWKPRGSRLGR